MASTVDPLLPLSLLRTVRTIDQPEELEVEFVPEMLNKRFGLSETVYAQIRRYEEAVRRQQRVSQDEATGIARLIGRRSDAEAIFRTAGRMLAQEAYKDVPASSRRAIAVLPSMMSRPMALRRANRIGERYLNGEVARLGSFVLLRVPDSVTLDTAPRAVGCTLYESALRELLRLMDVRGGDVEHVRCAGRGEGECEWRAEWRARAAS
jgi:predicted hydrocarbon binding protein